MVVRKYDVMKSSQKEKDILTYIKDFMLKRGYTPSIREIGDGVGLSSTSSVHQHFEKLVQMGYIEKHDKRYSVKGMRYMDDGAGEDVGSATDDGTGE